MHATLRNNSLGRQIDLEERADLKSPRLQAFLRDAANSDPTLDDVLCSVHSGRTVEVRVVGSPNGLTIRSQSPVHHHRPDCPCWEGSHGGGSGNPGVFAPSQLLQGHSESGERWDDLSDNWRSKSDFGGFAAWVLSEASLRAYLEVNPELPTLGAQDGVRLTPLLKWLEILLKQPAFRDGTSFDQLASQRELAWSFGILPKSFLEHGDQCTGAWGAIPLTMRSSHRGGIAPPVFVTRKTTVWRGRCKNIGGPIGGPYYFLALGTPRPEGLVLTHLALMPLAINGDFVAAVESRLERHCLLNHRHLFERGFKPILLSHLQDLYRACGLENADKLRVRLDELVPHPGGYCSGIEILGFDEATYLTDAWNKTRIETLSGNRVRLSFIQRRNGSYLFPNAAEIAAQIHPSHES